MPDFTGEEWEAYFRRQERNPARPLAWTATRGMSLPAGTVRRLLDLGSGTGNELQPFLDDGWQVVAVDRNAVSIDILSRKYDAYLGRQLTVVRADLTEYEPSRCHVIHAGFSLVYLTTAEFNHVWPRVWTSVLPAGRFVGQILSERDPWRQSGMFGVARADFASLVPGGRILQLQEAFGEGPTVSGRKTWGYFDVVVEKAAHLELPG